MCRGLPSSPIPSGAATSRFAELIFPGVRQTSYRLGDNRLWHKLPGIGLLDGVLDVLGVPADQVPVDATIATEAQTSYLVISARSFPVSQVM